MSMLSARSPINLPSIPARLHFLSSGLLVLFSLSQALALRWPHSSSWLLVLTQGTVLCVLLTLPSPRHLLQPIQAVAPLVRLVVGDAISRLLSTLSTRTSWFAQTGEKPRSTPTGLEKRFHVCPRSTADCYSVVAQTGNSGTRIQAAVAVPRHLVPRRGVSCSLKHFKETEGWATKVASAAQSSKLA